MRHRAAPAAPAGRRRLLQGTAGAALLWVGRGSLLGTLLASPLGRAVEHAPAFSAKRITDALQAYGTPNPVNSPLVSISGDELAERGENVRFVVHSTAPGIESLAVFVDKNPLPLAGTFRFANGALPHVALQLKLAESTQVRVVARTSDGQALQASRKVAVTISGCG